MSNNSRAAATKTPRVPVIEGLIGKVGILERRVEHLRGRLEVGTYRSTASADFDKVEVRALEAAIESMRYVDAVRGA